MKKVLVLLLCFCMMAASVMAGCGKEEKKEDTQGNASTDGKEDPESEKDNGSSETEKGYTFTAGDVVIAVDADMAPIADALGEPNSYFEEPSCAAQGIAKLYYYSGYEINTYPDGDKDLVACVILKDDTVATEEGVDLSMTKDQVIQVYGEDYKESAGQIYYEKDGMKLCFLLDGEYLKAIEYNSSVLD